MQRDEWREEIHVRDAWTEPKQYCFWLKATFRPDENFFWAHATHAISFEPRQSCVDTCSLPTPKVWLMPCFENHSKIFKPTIERTPPKNPRIHANHAIYQTMLKFREKLVLLFKIYPVHFISNEVFRPDI